MRSLTLNSRNGILLGLSLIVVTGTSCRIFRPRKSVKTTPVVVTPVPGDQPGDSSAATAADAVPAGSPAVLRESLATLSRASRPESWTTFGAKADVHYEGKGDSRNFDIDVRIEKDKRIWVRVIGSLLGIKGEGARLLLTPDSIQALDKINSVAYLLPWSEAGKLLPAGLDFQTVQTLFLGGAFGSVFGPVAVSGDALTRTVSITSDSLVQAFVQQRSDSSLQRQSLLSRREAGPALTQEYREYKPVPGGRFSFDRIIQIRDKGEQYDVTISFGKVDWNTALEYPFSVPPKYERK